MPSPEVLVRYSTFDELRTTSELDEPGWLTDVERSEWDRHRHPESRAAWWFGRILAKQTLMQTTGLSDPAEVIIRSLNAAGQSVRPAVTLSGQRYSGCLSISHADNLVLVALTDAVGVTVGADITPIRVPPPGFLKTWFTEREREQLAPNDPPQVARVWAAKEAIYKACNQGESFAPRTVEIIGSAAEELTCCYRGAELTDRTTIHSERIDEQMVLIAAVHGSESCVARFAGDAVGNIIRSIEPGPVVHGKPSLIGEIEDFSGSSS
jgi:phosphopantetheinyl transferase